MCAFYPGPQGGLTVKTIPQGQQHHTPILKMRKLIPGEVWRGGACQGLSVLVVSWFQGSGGAGHRLCCSAFLGPGPRRGFRSWGGVPEPAATSESAPNRVLLFSCTDET